MGHTLPDLTARNSYSDFGVPASVLIASAQNFDLTVLPEKPLQAPLRQSKRLGNAPTMNLPARNTGPRPGTLQGDAVQLEYYEDGYPKLPACLDRGAGLNHLRRLRKTALGSVHRIGRALDRLIVKPRRCQAFFLSAFRVC
jgi:hypothetical protein